MNAQEILSKVDHTLLKQTATWEDIKGICEEAVKYHTATVMIPSCFITKIRENYGGKLKIATVVGFPNGNCNTAAKIAETAQALADGAEEIDMVINIGMLKAGETEYVTEEIRALKRLCGERVLKVIVETCFLTEEEKIAACKCVTEAGADFIKTSTGFGSKGATLEDIKLFKEHIGEGVQMKAAGGIHTREEMVGFIEAGCTRLGASAAVKVLKDEVDK
ncbi:deoxyribose-phosphate aldolase [Selenomonas ruminantium]|jgi:deoxyribose-phosphate aldolase|uniref:Deoxyribose-phosphate aldolase n=1 Tax=Selenomonas ruminantium TaxID=971 RepID=A0A1K1P6Q2_SELRU|nr:deoxyribose-phosphate aldolase [Selenomonas ruminantium]SEA28478.1 deoxyribose-phosphate aldolase [Selenomonas ruminantium]SFW43260.1 deoxyribose-phosphate aldolase [Selenomonas ruminantium]